MAEPVAQPETLADIIITLIVLTLEWPQYVSWGQSLLEVTVCDPCNFRAYSPPILEACPTPLHTTYPCLVVWDLLSAESISEHICKHIAHTTDVHC
jgi:hypothetical protein